MQGDDLSILLFWITLAVTFGYEAVKAETKLRRIGLGLLAGLFLLCGVFWLQIKKIWPPLTDAMVATATSPQSWFVLFIFICAVILFGTPKRTAREGRLRSRNPDDGENSEMIAQLGRDISGLRREFDMLTSLAADTARETKDKLDRLEDAAPTTEEHNKLGVVVVNLLKEHSELAHNVGGVADQIRTLRQEVTPLLRATIYSIYESQADKFLALAPSFQVSDVIEDAAVYAERREIAEKFVGNVVTAWRQTRFRDGLQFCLEQAGYEGEAMVKETPPDKRPAIDPLDYRVYAIAVQKAYAATAFLRAVKKEVGDDYRNKLREFIDLHTRYEGR